MFDLPLESSYWAPNPDHPLYYVFNKPERIPLEDIPEPFIYLYHSMATHVPYDPSFKGTGRDYMKKFGRNTSKLRSDYKIAVNLACEEFLNNVYILKRRGILDRTLIIFTSDHGEILGPMFHIFPACPETVYVPTVFIGPGIPAGRKGKGIIRQVDILPTIIELLGIDVKWFFEGVNVFRNNRKLLGFNYYVRKYRGGYVSLSVWDEEGGYVKLEGSTWLLLKSAVADAIRYTHDLSPFKYHKRVRVFGHGIENAEYILEVFRSQPTYGYADNILLSPLNESYAKEKTRIRIRKKIRELRRKLKGK